MSLYLGHVNGIWQMQIFVWTEHYNGLCLRRQTSPEFSCNLSISRFIIENDLNLWPTKNSNQIMHRNFLLSTQTCHPVVSAFHPRSVSSSDPGVGDPEFWTTSRLLWNRCLHVLSPPVGVWELSFRSPQTALQNISQFAKYEPYWNWIPMY